MSLHIATEREEDSATMPYEGVLDPHLELVFIWALGGPVTVSRPAQRYERLLTSHRTSTWTMTL